MPVNAFQAQVKQLPNGLFAVEPEAAVGVHFACRRHNPLVGVGAKKDTQDRAVFGNSGNDFGGRRRRRHRGREERFHRSQQICLGCAQ